VLEVTAHPKVSEVPVSPGDDWDKHWNAYADSASVNPAQAYRRQLILEALMLPTAPRPVRLLELGCGQGDFAQDLLAQNPDAELCGLDLAQKGVEIARRKVPNASFFQQDLTQPMAIPEQFRGWATHAVCSEVLEHVDDPVAVLRNVRTCLAPGCRLVITVPAGPLSAFDRHIGHRAHFTPQRLDDVLRAAGLEVPDLRGAGFPFFNLYRLAVVARGRALIRDAAGDDARGLPVAARATIRLFSWLFRLNSARGRLGWQLIAVGVEPGRVHAS
jgi:SAM-dependent methyltransferase